MTFVDPMIAYEAHRWMFEEKAGEQ
jgi:hypothetical protein